MKCYLIDYENVRTEGLNSLTQIEDGDECIIFYSDQCRSINLDTIERLTDINVKIKCQKVTAGTKNALDFQLSSFLGHILAKRKKGTSYSIVSNDKGYDCLCGFWSEKGFAVSRTGTK